MKKTIAEKLIIILISTVSGLLFFLALFMRKPYQFAAFAVVIAITLIFMRRTGFFGHMHGLIKDHRSTFFITVAVLLMILPFALSSFPYWIGVFVLIGIFVALAVGLNVCVGFVGLLDLGYVAFFAVGAYSTAIFTRKFPDLWYSVWLAFPVSIMLAGILGLLVGIPTLRLRGDYMAIVTLGFIQIVYLTTGNWDGLTNGPRGFDEIPAPKIGSFSLGENFNLFGIEFQADVLLYLMVIFFVGLIVFTCHRLSHSRIGRAWVAVREDELAAEAMGVNTMRVKLSAYVLGACIAGCCGVLFAVTQNSIIPSDFDFMKSALLLCMVVLGGMGNIAGVVIGAVLIALLDEKLQFLHQYRMAIFGLTLIVMMILRPAGLIPSKRRRLELQFGSRHQEN